MMVMPTTAEVERSKYERAWAVPGYETTSPGERFVDAFLEESGAMPPESIIDLGCGAGRVSADLASRGFRVTRLDLTRKALRVKDDLPLIEQPLWEPIRGVWDFGYCCDVMEHIPIEYTMAVLHRISEACRACWFSIAFAEDNFGATIGETLHLTVMPYQWWLAKLGEGVGGSPVDLQFQEYLQRLIEDCAARPQVKKARQLTMKMTIEPTLNEFGRVDGAMVDFTFEYKCPSATTRPYSCAVLGPVKVCVGDTNHRALFPIPTPSHIWRTVYPPTR